jgi:integrase
MRARGNGASTINCHLSTVGVMFKHFDVQSACRVPYVREPKNLKWWLTPEVEAQATGWMTANGYHDLRDYTIFVVRTGLRLEEVLRCQRTHFTGLATARPSLSIPGTKTAAAQASIPLLPEAAALALARLGPDGDPCDYLFAGRTNQRTWKRHNGGPSPMRYHDLQEPWLMCRRAIGLGDVRGATLKAFRRSFARIGSDRGVPTEILQKYLRHELISTTMEYLRLTGGSDVERMRQWFS